MASITKFGEKIKLRREELGISQEQLGNLCGVSRRTIVSYETMVKLWANSPALPPSAAFPGPWA